MTFTIIAVVASLGLFFGMLLLLEFGRRVGIRRMALDPEGARAGAGAVDGAIFGLMGLLIAFTFSGAASRFDTRRQLLIQEVNAIGTAWLRLDLLPADAQSALRESFRRYLDTRLEVYRKMPDMVAAKAELARSAALQGMIWTQSVAACREGPPPAAMLLLPALNDMFDITTTRTMAAEAHPPTIIFGMLVALALVSSLLAGYAMAGGKRHGWIHMLGFAAIMTLTVYVIIDIEYPRVGLVRLDSYDRVMVELRQSMK